MALPPERKARGMVEAAINRSLNDPDVARLVFDEQYHTLPQLVPRQGGVVVFSLCRCESPASASNLLFPPSPTLWATIDTDDRPIAREMDPAQLGLRVGPAGEIGSLDDLAGLSVDERLSLHAHYLSLLDRIHAEGHLMARAYSDAGLALARETARVFDRLCEDALRPYYEHVAPDFMAWLRA